MCIRDSYRGYPDGETVYLCFFYLSGSVRRKGVGSRTVGALCGALREKGFVRARVAVSLKNWPGIRFWQTCGFGRITKVSFDAPFSAENYGCLELEKVL